MVNGDAQPRRVSVAQGRTRFSYTLPAQSVATFEWRPASARPPAAASPATAAAPADPRDAGG